MQNRSDYMYGEITKALTSLKAKRPLIECLTNTVTINDCANIILAIGASPIMAEDISEVEEVVALAGAVVLNIGTLSAPMVASMLKAGKKANELNVPVVFDPVGVGATQLRNNMAKKILSEVNISVIRGNMSEIRALAGLTSFTKGVDVSDVDAVKWDNIKDGIKIAGTLAQKHNCIVAATGEIDIIATPIKKAYLIDNGHEMLASVTGTGCMSTALVGAYCGGTNNYAAAAAAGILTMCIAGEKAYEIVSKNGAGSGTYRTLIMDYTYNLSVADILGRGKIYEAEY